MQNITKIPSFWLVTLWYPGGDIDKKYILSKSQGLVAANPYPPPLFEKKPIVFLFFFFFFFTFQDENSQKERYNERRYKFYFFFLFGNFPLKCEKKQWKGKMIFFSLVYTAKAYWTFVLFHFSWNKKKNNKTIIFVKGPLPPCRGIRDATF
jgi:hypothetical protein